MFELSKLRFQMNSAIRKKGGTDHGRTHGRTDPHIESLVRD